MQIPRAAIPWAVLAILAAPLLAAPRPAPGAELRDRVLGALARRAWKQTEQDLLGSPRWQRVARDVAWADSAFHPAWDGWVNEDALGCGESGDSDTAGDAGGDCSHCLNSIFHDGPDTVSFTPGHIEETCGGSAPWMRWWTSSRRPVRRQLAALGDWNVEALWTTPHYLVLRMCTSNEACFYDDGLAFLELETGRWAILGAGSGNWTRKGVTELRELCPRREEGDDPALVEGPKLKVHKAGVHKAIVHLIARDSTGVPPPGSASKIISEVSFMEVQGEAEAAELDSAVVLRSRGHCLGFWPAQHQWAVLDAATGRGVPVEPWVAARRFEHPPGGRAGAPLRAALLKAFRGWNSDASEVLVQQLMRPACGVGSGLVAVIAAGGAAREAAGSFAGWQRGVFLVDSTLGRVEQVLDTLRVEDSVIFDPASPPDSIVVVGADSDYGCGRHFQVYPCPVKGR